MTSEKNVWILNFSKGVLWNKNIIDPETGKMGAWEDKLVAKNEFRCFVPDKNGLIPDEEGNYECDNNIHEGPVFISRGVGYWTIRIIRKYEDVASLTIIDKVEITRQYGNYIYKITITETIDENHTKNIWIYTPSHEKRKVLIATLEKKGREFIFVGSKIKLTKRASFDSIKMMCAEIM